MHETHSSNHRDRTATPALIVRSCISSTTNISTTQPPPLLLNTTTNLAITTNISSDCNISTATNKSANAVVHIARIPLTMSDRNMQLAVVPPQTPAQTFPFLRLVPELRLQVYQRLFTVPEFSVKRTHVTIRKSPTKQVQLQVALFRSCITIAKEALEVLYSGNKFSFHCQESARRFLARIGNDNATYLRKVTFRDVLSIDIFSDDVNTIGDLRRTFAPCTNLSIVKLRVEEWLSLPKSQLMPSRNPDLTSGRLLTEATAENLGSNEDFLGRSYLQVLAKRGVQLFVDLTLFRQQDSDRFFSEHVDNMAPPYEYRYRVKLRTSAENGCDEAADAREPKCKFTYVGLLCKKNGNSAYLDDFSDEEDAGEDGGYGNEDVELVDSEDEGYTGVGGDHGTESDE
ncbi:hypothetical protein EJ08DRAFT_32086 [Tothia fuscella]|uniref:Uncharacterized protein n=1 Tax=Tothia fuscella TaxID=1048955 RepID=A0A9P4NG94_9PEZI|nr:hypothetical protein EJ08DRAFT_32086 [Tothia fuscella]